MPVHRPLWVFATWCLVACEERPPLPETPPPAAAAPLPRSAIAAAEASSALASGTFTALQAVDGDAATAWCEGVDGLGAGESLTIRLQRPTRIAAILVDGGYFKDDRTLTNNGRPRKIHVTTDAGFAEDLVLPFVPLREHRAETIPVKPARIQNLGQVSSVTFTLVEADAGRFTQDTCISEIVLIPE